MQPSIKLSSKVPPSKSQANAMAYAKQKFEQDSPTKTNVESAEIDYN